MPQGKAIHLDLRLQLQMVGMQILDASHQIIVNSIDPSDVNADAMKSLL